jgi:amino acid adenylation domain-containing protein
MRDLERRLGALPPEARRLLELRLQRGKEEAASAPVRRGATRAPLSFAQRRMWFLDRLEPGALYNSPLALRVRGALDAGALEGALAEVVRRHESLRSVIRAETGAEAEQVVLPPGPFLLPTDDLSALPAAAREDEARCIVHDEVRRPFDLAAGPLLRARLLRLADEEHVLVLAMHHVVSDGWSLGVLFRELGALYDAFSRGAAPPLDPLPLQYADYAAWQREHWTEERLAAQLEWWRRALAAAPAVLELPADRSRPAVQSHRGARLRVALPGELAEGVRALARREGATPFMVMLAAFQVLLWRWSGEEDLVVGSPVAGRTRTETEGLIGFFVNTLPLRADLSGDPAFATLLHRVRETTLGAYQHQELPFERLVEALHPERSLGHAPVFQHVFALQNATPAELHLPGVRMEVMATESGTARFDLEWSLWEREEGITGAIHYAEDLFDRETVERMAGHYRRLLEAAVARPGARVSTLPLLSGDERARLVAEAAGPDLSLPDLPVHRLFEAQAARTPDAVAAEAEEGALTYAELDRRANRLAHHLRARDVGPEALVAICVHRGAPMLEAMLAALKAGGGYLPLDPDYPADRIAYMLGDSGARVLVTRSGLMDGPPPRGVDLVILDRDADEIAAHPDTPPAIPYSLFPIPCSLAYVIYTSGSTGRPKGVRVEHGALAATMAAAGRAFGLASGDRVPSLASFAFDIWLFESFLPLLAGGTVRLFARERVLEVPRLVRDLAGCTVLHAVPALMRSIVQEVRARPGGVLPALRRAFVGGDAVAPDLLEEMRHAFPAAEIHVLYGPTEAAVICAAHRLGGEPATRQMVGRPLGNAALHVLEPGGSVAPAGVAGELCLGGGSVARDYLGRPGLTAERFVPDPFSAQPGARLYRTGDRVRRVEVRACESAEVRKENGLEDQGEDAPTLALSHPRTFALEFLGRTDRQVKVRGFRIEPGEIESALRRHPDVDDAVVAVAGEGDARRLAAWVVPSPAAGAPEVEALKVHLRGGLPDFMVPQAFVFLERFPLTPSGKVDRRALPAARAAAETAAYVEPSTPTERAVADVFGQVLGVERVGAADDFFSLGGHSLLAMHVWSHLEDRCGVSLPLRTLFEHPVVRALAAAVDAAPRAEGADAAVRITPRTRDVETEIELRGERVRAYAAPVSFSQQRLWMLDRMDPGRAMYAVPLALRLRGALDGGALRRALDALGERHESLRTVFRWMEGGAMQVVLPRGALPVELVDLTPVDGGGREAELRRRLADEAARPFDLEQGPLARIHLYRLDADDHVLLLNLHHVVTDGWSTGVLLRELSALYGAFARGEPSPLSAPGLQYADYAAWQREHLSGAVYQAHLAYWKEALANAPALLELPVDRPRPAVWEGRGAAERFRLPPEVADAVDALARAEGCTPFMVLLAAFQALLGRYARQDDVVVGTPVANRARPETRDVVGFFVNTLALRAELSGDPSFRGLLHRVREGAMGAFAHQEMPFERLVDELKVPRSAAHSPVFQVMFSLQTADDAGASLPGFRSERVPVEGTHAPFDLTLALRPGEEGMDGALEYATALFDRVTALRLIAHFRTLLAAACAAPDEALSALPLLSADEVDAALRAGEGPALESPTTFALIHERIAVQAARAPEAIAVDGGAERITYAELDARSDALARRLRALGVRPGALVAVRAERSVETVAAVLAVLRAGGAYLPLDPSYPGERQAYMLEDSRAALLLDGTGAGAPHGYAGPVADLAELAASAEAPPRPAPAIPCSLFPVPCSPEDLAYVIYTSGSTGRPKGVAVPHHALSAYVDAARQAYDLTPADRFLQFAPLSFDSSVEELFAPLAAGATMVLRDGEMMESVDGFWRACARQRLTLASLPTAYWHELAAAMDAVAPPVPPSLRVMIVGGERALPERVASWRKAVGGRVRLINSYGPTETTVAATLHTVEDDEPVVPIGRPMPGYRVRVLDASLRPVPAGIPGELFIGGIGVARGYPGRPALTAARFVPDPFAAAPGERLYRTGDLVRWREEKSAGVRECVSADVNPGSADFRTDALTHSRTAVLEFLGRTDDQVKVRGFRIEPGEIESLLRRHPGVRDAVVAVREDAPGDRRLVAYLVAEDGPPPVDAVRAAVRAALPAYMVPSAFVALDALPMTPSGKVDRRALPAPQAGDPAAPAVPLSRRERELAEVWRQVLGTDAVGPDDNFFDLGGNSLLLIRLAARLQEETGVAVTAVELFRFSTVRALAAHLAGADGAAGEAPVSGRDERLRQGTSRLRNLRRGAAV